MKIPIVGNLKVEDDFMHAIEPVPNYSESALFHYAGRNQSGEFMGGIIRVANRPNEGYAECTVLVWLPDGSALFNFERPSILNNRSWQAAGWKIEVIEPGGVAFRSSYEGSVLMLADPRMMAEPKFAFKEPRVGLHFDLQHEGKAPLTEFKPHRPLDTPDQRERYGTSGMQQLMKSSGTIKTESGLEHEFRGFGWRDHNWGPRNWQGFTNHTFLTGNFGIDQGFSLFSTVDGHGYYLHRGLDKVIDVEALSVETDYSDKASVPTSLRASVLLVNGEQHTVEGRRKAYIPLRNRRDGMVTTLGYSLWEYVLDGRIEGFGHGEFLSQSWAEGDVRYFHERRAN